MIKSSEAYKTIGEVAKILESSSKNTKSITTHTIRFWEKEFKQIKPHIFSGNRRYYDDKSIEILKKIHFLLKDKGMTYVTGYSRSNHLEQFAEAFTQYIFNPDQEDEDSDGERDHHALEVDQNEPAQHCSEEDGRTAQDNCHLRGLRLRCSAVVRVIVTAPNESRYVTSGTCRYHAEKIARLATFTPFLL